MSEQNIYDESAKPYRALWLTTEDNPYDFFEQFDQWYQYDTTHGYNTCGLIARLIPDDTSFDISREHEAINDIICNFVKRDPLKQYIVVGKEITPETVKAGDFGVLQM